MTCPMVLGALEPVVDDPALADLLHREQQARLPAMLRHSGADADANAMPAAWLGTMLPSAAAAADGGGASGPAAGSPFGAASQQRLQQQWPSPYPAMAVEGMMAAPLLVHHQQQPCRSNGGGGRLTAGDGRCGAACGVGEAAPGGSPPACPSWTPLQQGQGPRSPPRRPPSSYDPQALAMALALAQGGCSLVSPPSTPFAQDASSSAAPCLGLSRLFKPASGSQLLISSNGSGSGSDAALLSDAMLQQLLLLDEGSTSCGDRSSAGGYDGDGDSRAPALGRLLTSQEECSSSCKRRGALLLSYCSSAESPATSTAAGGAHSGLPAASAPGGCLPFAALLTHVTRCRRGKAGLGQLGDEPLQRL